MTAPRVLDFIHDVSYRTLPEPVREQGRRCMLDLLGTAAGALATDGSRVIRTHAVRHFGAGGASARILFDGRPASPTGAALAAAMTIDSLDAHDGHKLAKGHAGAAVLPALLAYWDAAEKTLDADEVLAVLVLGYELAVRVGIATHSQTKDYHSSGSWNAVAAAGMGARLLGLDGETTRHALGIAEYYAPRSQMMRSIDHPTMLKDGSGWGAMCGVSAAYLAADGFTGAPAVTVEDAASVGVWDDLGTGWRILETYFKPYPVCYWAQPAVGAALALQREHGFSATDIETIDVLSFHEAVRLATRRPRTSEAAQYSLPFPVAAALVRGRIGWEEVTDGLQDPDILALSDRVRLEEAEAYNARFPGERIAQVTIRLAGGRTLISEPTQPRGDPERPLAAEELIGKFHELADGVLGADRSAAIERAVMGLGPGSDADGLADLLLTAPEPVQRRARAI